MKKNIILSICLSFALITFGQKNSFVDSTLAHKLLRMEQEASSTGNQNFQEKYNLLDSLIEYSTISIKLFLERSVLDEKTAIQVLSKIDSSLYSLGFITKIGTNTLSESLTSRILDKKAARRVTMNDKRPGNSTVYYYLNFNGSNSYNYFFTREKLDMFVSDNRSHYYWIDCDLSAMIYISIAQRLGLTVHLVEVPGHNFVRFEYDQGKFVNWDTNAAAVFTNDEYKEGLTPTSNSKVTDVQIKSQRYLENMNLLEVLGYHYVNAARIAEANDTPLQAKKLLESAIEIRPYSTLAMNNLSWLLTTNEAFTDKTHAEKALELSRKVDSVEPNDKNYKDTYSCACAAVGDFKEAIRIEEMAFNDPLKIKGFKLKMNCLEMKL